MNGTESARPRDRVLAGTPAEAGKGTSQPTLRCCVAASDQSSRHPRFSAAVEKTLSNRGNITPARSLLRQVVNRTGAFRQFISKATRLKLPGGLLTTRLGEAGGTAHEDRRQRRMQAT
jgi:hypothetical protein